MYSYKLSVIIPTYNTAEYLERTINNLVNQSLKDCEIIIIDDNSTDNTEAIVETFKLKYKNIKYIKNDKNLGAGLSRNIGLKHSTGEYITFMDSDDWADLVTYETAVSALDRNPNCEIAIWGIKTEYNNKNSSLIRTNYEVYNTIDKDFALSLLCNTYSLDISISSYLGSKIFRSIFLKTNEITFNKLLFEDVLFSFKAIYYAQNIILLPNIYTHYYQRFPSVIHSFTKKHISDMFNVLSCVRLLIDNDFLRYKKNYASLVEKCSKTLFKILYDNITDPKEQKKLLCYYFELLFNDFNLESIFDYLDSERIKNIFLNF